jgi:hypothetical protein
MITTIRNSGVLLTIALALTALVPVVGSIASAQAADAPAEAPYTVEYYYRVKWGHQEDFLRLYAKNHLPLLERHRKNGMILELRTEAPRFHAAEAERWDYRVTIVWKNVEIANDDSGDAAILRELFPDRARFEREEKERFELLLGHWDVPVKAVEPDAG